MGIMPPLTGIHPENVNALAAVDKIYPRPVLFIHSVDDLKVPSINSAELYEKHPDKFEFWQTSGANHVGTYKLQSQAYMDHLLAFIKKN
jgi:fermentation-respiration switch protein FrsA (DUF1100 family)